MITQHLGKGDTNKQPCKKPPKTKHNKTDQMKSTARKLKARRYNLSPTMLTKQCTINEECVVTENNSSTSPKHHALDSLITQGLG